MNIPVKKGMLLKHQGHYFFVEDLVEHHSGKQRPVVHVKLREALTGRHIERTIDELVPLEEVGGQYRTLQYLYAKGAAHVFMDAQSFEEMELTDAQLQGRAAFLKEGQEFRVLFAGEQALKLDMPDNVLLAVADTAAASHAVGAAGSVLKEARLENGLEIRVPLFIKTGDVVKVDTRTMEYLGKAQG